MRKVLLELVTMALACAAGVAVVAWCANVAARAVRSVDEVFKL